MNRLFSADGIRGIIDKHPLRMEDVERLGRAVATWLRQEIRAPTLLLGIDTRESSQRLRIALVDGLTRAGVCVVDAGILPTAAISYLIANKGLFASGVMISASHNPVVENGIKVFDHRGIKLGDDDENIIENLYFGAEALPFEIRPAPAVQESGYARQYAHALAEEYRDYEWQTCRVAIDCANGAAYQVSPLVLSELKIPYTLLNASPDGTNINLGVGSEHVRVNPGLFAALVCRHGAGVGFAIDGDADRVIFVDSEGRLYDGDMLMSMLALKLQREARLRQQTVVTTPMSNSGFEYYLHKWGIQTRLVGNGDKYITEALVKDDLSLGGEQIGHVIIHTDKTRVTGDGLRTALHVLTEMVCNPGITLQDLAPGMRKWPQVKGSAYIGQRACVPPEEIPGMVALMEEIRKAIPDLAHFECRPASTEPVYRIMIEARLTGTPVLAAHARRIAEHVQRQLGCLGLPIQIVNCVTGGYV